MTRYHLPNYKRTITTKTPTQKKRGARKHLPTHQDRSKKSVRHDLSRGKGGGVQRDDLDYYPGGTLYEKDEVLKNLIVDSVSTKPTVKVS